MARLLEGDRLEQRARELRVDISGEPRDRSASGRAERAPDCELQRRVAEATPSIRESRPWWLAVISAFASVASAIAALIAVARK
jgi:hypothetical protein